jgi:GAF domain-containing protein
MDAIAPNTLSRFTQLLAQDDPEELLQELMVVICEELSCDRCFLFLRNPCTRRGIVTHCACMKPKWQDLTGATWLEDEEIETTDPLMAIAFRTEEPVFVSDIETASPEVVNQNYEREQFGHRALIHLPIYQQEQLVAILEPCVFGHSREWNKGDRQLIQWLQEKIRPIIATYSQSREP